MTDFEQHDLPGGWAWTTLAAIAEVVTGNTPPKSDVANYGNTIPLIKPSELGGLAPVIEGNEYLSVQGAAFARILPPYSVMVTCIGATIGKLGITGVQAATNQQINSLIIKNKTFAYYTFYYCLSSFFQKQLLEQSSATTIPIINKSKFSQLPIPVAPPAEQARIVEAIAVQLSRIEAGLAAARRAQQALRRYKASVLNAACTGRLLPQDEQDEPADVLLQRILTERRARWEAEQLQKYEAQGKNPPKGWQDKYAAPAEPNTSDLPELPRGWVWTGFDQILTELRNGYFGGTPLKEPPGIPILRINSVRPLSVSYDSISYLPESDSEKISPYLLRNGDLLFTRYNGTLELVGVCGLVRNLADKMLYPDKLIRARVLLPPDYLELFFATSVPRTIIENKAKSTAGQTGIAGTEIKQLPVALPPLAEQERIVAEVERRLSVVAALEHTVSATLTRAARLRQGVLRRAFRGELVAQDPTDEGAGGVVGARYQ